MVPARFDFIIELVKTDNNLASTWQQTKNHPLQQRFEE
jgi:hypothetical protein